MQLYVHADYSLCYLFTVLSLKDKSLAVLESSASFSVSGAIKDAIYSRSRENWGEIFDDDFDVRQTYLNF
mgnify:CR=1 FL=1